MIEDMAAKGTFPIKVDNNLHGVGIVLKSAACEWLLLFFLLLDAAFSYFLTKFAQYCDLQVPCILCSRLDHVFSKEKPDFYRNLICNDHKSELSSSILCQNHGKLVNVHDMCEECLLSFAKKDLNEEMHKILVGKLRLDCLQTPFLSMDSHIRSCSCCGKPWRSRPNVQKSVQSKLSSHASKPDIPLPKSPAHKSLNRQEGLKKRNDHFSTSPLVDGHTNYDSRSHIGYTKGRVNFDSESDFQYSDDDYDMINVPRHPKSVEDDCLSHLGSKSPQRQYEDFLPPGLIHRNHDTGMLMHPDDGPEKGETTTPTCLRTNGDGRHIFAETNLQQICMKPNSTISKFVSLDHVPISSNVPETSPIVSAKEGDKLISKNFGSSELSSHLLHNNASPSKNIQLPCGLSKGKSNNWESIDLNNSSTVMGNGTDDTRKEVKSMSDSSTFNDLNINKQVETFSSVPEQLAKMDCDDSESNGGRVDLEASISDDQKLTENGHIDREPMSVSIESPELPKSPNKMESSRSLKSLQESVKIEFNNLVQKLRQELEHSKKCIANLQKELEEERNASTVAANQAMAMITKLQEEKAALNMESLQYLRMMEEQSEYDMEALEKANDLLNEKENEVQDLEAELDYFRLKYPEDFPEYLNMHDEESADMNDSNMETVDFES